MQDRGASFLLLCSTICTAALSRACMRKSHVFNYRVPEGRVLKERGGGGGGGGGGGAEEALAPPIL